MRKIKSFITVSFLCFLATAIEAAPQRLNLGFGTQSHDGAISAAPNANNSVSAPPSPIVVIEDVPAPPPPPPPPAPVCSIVGYGPPVCSAYISGWVKVYYSSWYKCESYGVMYDCEPTYTNACVSEPIYECH